MESDELLYSPFGSEALDADVFSPDDIFAGYRILVRHNYNLLCGLYEVESVEDKKHKMMLILPKMVGTEEGFSERFEKINRQLQDVNASGLLTLEDFGRHEGRFFMLYESFHGMTLPDFFAEKMKTKLETEEDEPPTASPDESAEPEKASDPFAATVDEIYPHEKAGGKAAPPEASVPTLDEPYLSPAGVRGFVQKVGGALHRLHRSGIHHYNLASPSILTDGEAEFKLWGAGLYEMVGKPLFERLASTGIPPIIAEDQRRLLNPIEGLAPEVRRGLAPDVRADVHGLAAIAYELLTGRQPGANPKPPVELSPDFEKPWNNLLMRGLEKATENRHETIDEFIAEMEGRKRPALSKQRKLWMKRVALTRDFIVKNLLVLLTFMLALVGVVLFYQWTSQSTVETEVTPGPRPVTVVQTDDAATHIVQLEPKNASVTLFDPSPRTVQPDEDGLVLLRVREGNPLIRVEAAGFRSTEQRLAVSDEPQELSIALEIAYATPVFSAAEDSEVWFRRVTADGRTEWELLGEIAEGGEGSFGQTIGQGTYDFEVRHSMFRSVRFREIELEADQVLNLEAVQSALPASLRISGSPGDGVVSVNEITLGSPPLLAEGINPDKPVQIRFERQGYRTLEKELSLEPAQEKELDLGSLERIFAPVTLRVTGMDRSLIGDQRLTVRRGDDALEIDAEGIVSLPIGEYSLAFEHPNFEALRKRATIREDVDNTIDATLDPKPAVVSLNIVPEAAFTLRINERSVTAARNFRLPPGRQYKLDIVVERHAPFTKTLRPGPNERIELTIDPAFLTPPDEGDNWTFPYQDFEFVWIAPGDFMMGSPRTEPHRLPNEADGSGAQIRTVFTRGFWMSETPVTQGFYEQVMSRNRNPSRFANSRHPVESISWKAAVAFTEKLTELERKADRLPEGYVYRLPTQAEWEYTARAGTETPFYWGDRASPKNANFQGTFPRSKEMPEGADARSSTTPVRSYPANPWGLYDMIGNVRSLTLDPYNGRFPVTRPLTDWVETRSSDRIVVRGGGWSDTADRSRAASRDRMDRDQINDHTGFRIVLGLELNQGETE